MSAPTDVTFSFDCWSHAVTAETSPASGTNCATYCSWVRNLWYCELDGSLTAFASAASPAALRGASQTLADSCCDFDTRPEGDAFAVQAGFVPWSA